MLRERATVAVCQGRGGGCPGTAGVRRITASFREGTKSVCLKTIRRPLRAPGVHPFQTQILMPTQRSFDLPASTLIRDSKRLPGALADPTLGPPVANRLKKKNPDATKPDGAFAPGCEV